jgi:N-acetylglutamate synthase-like GNAT family acetyltransferase
MSAPVVRAATPDDVPQVCQFVRQLADYEKLLHEVKFEDEQFMDNLFLAPPSPGPEVLIVEVDSKPVGFALYIQLNSSMIYLEDLYVGPECRGKGAGIALLGSIAQVAIDRNVSELRWRCLDWNTSSIQFYESIGARRVRDESLFRLEGDALTRRSGRCYQIDEIVERDELAHTTRIRLPYEQPPTSAYPRNTNWSENGADSDGWSRSDEAGSDDDAAEAAWWAQYHGPVIQSDGLIEESESPDPKRAEFYRRVRDIYKNWKADPTIPVRDLLTANGLEEFLAEVSGDGDLLHPNAAPVHSYNGEDDDTSVTPPRIPSGVSVPTSLAYSTFLAAPVLVAMRLVWEEGNLQAIPVIIESLRREAVRKGYCRLDIWVDLEAMQWLEHLLMDSFGAAKLSEWIPFGLAREQLIALANRK